MFSGGVFPRVSWGIRPGESAGPLMIAVQRGGSTLPYWWLRGAVGSGGGGTTQPSLSTVAAAACC